MTDFIAFFSLFFIVYTYLGYPILLLIWPKRKGVRSKYSDYRPTITVLIAAFNEEANIGKTIISMLESNYPSDKLEIIISSDASTDKTDEIVRSFNNKGVKLHRMKSRSGKFEAQKQAFKLAQGEIILLADASGQFDSDALKTLMRHFTDPTIGSSVGRKIIKKAGTSVAKGEGLYGDMNLNFAISKVSLVQAGLDVKEALPRFEKTSYHLIIKAGSLKTTLFAAGFMKKVIEIFMNPGQSFMNNHQRIFFLNFSERYVSSCVEFRRFLLLAIF